MRVLLYSAEDGANAVKGLYCDAFVSKYAGARRFISTLDRLIALDHTR